MATKKKSSKASVKRTRAKGRGKKTTRKRKAAKKRTTQKKTTRRKKASTRGTKAASRARPKVRASRGSVFDIDMLPADEGDCLIVTYGPKSRPSRILIDCGTQSTVPRLEKRLRELKPKVKTFDLFVLTHVDGDHIGGAIDFFNEGAGGLTFRDVWFNGWSQLPGREFLSARQGEVFEVLLKDNKQPWNLWTGGKTIQVRGDELPTHKLKGGMEITLLSPGPDQLRRLAKVWAGELKKHGFVMRDGRIDQRARKQHYRKFLGGESANMRNVRKLADSRFRNDTSKPNGSSIGFLAEFGGRSVLFSGDAHAPVLASSIRKLLRQRGEERLRLDAFKLPHHGSRANVSKPLLDLIDCDHYLVSSSGAKFKHPDGEALSRVVVYGGDEPTLHFNYTTPFNDFWGKRQAQAKFGFRARHPAKGKEGLRVSL